MTKTEFIAYLEAKLDQLKEGEIELEKFKF